MDHRMARPFVMGIVTGLRALTVPAAISLAGHIGTRSLRGSHAAQRNVKAHPVPTLALTVLAIGEFIGDKSSAAPDRRKLSPFAGRMLSGAICGAVSSPPGWQLRAAAAGAAGALVGTLGGAKLRTGLARVFGRDMPAALIEDATALIGAILITRTFRH